MSNPSVAQHALSLRDVLLEIFLYLTRGEIASNARVCKVWQSLALGEVWRNASIVGLVALLAPLTRKAPDIVVFSHAIHASDWARFDKYAWRVRCICFDATTCKYGDSVFSQIAHARPRLNLLPNLTEIKLCGSHPLSVVTLFGHASVKTLVITSTAIDGLSELDEQSITESSAMLSYLPTQMPNLRDFRVEASGDQSLFFLAGPLTLALRSLSFLEELHLPTTLMTNDMVISLSLLPYLRCIKMLPSINPAPLDSLPSNGFPSLKIFGARASIAQAALWFFKPGFAKDLTSLSFSSPYLARNSSIESYRDLAGMIASNFKFLVHLSLSPAISAFVLLPFDVLEPILSLSTLQTLRIMNQNTIEVKRGDLVKIFKSLPNLILLSFQLDPHYLPKFSIAALAALSPLAPNLTTLALTFNDGLSDDLDVDTVVPFRKLRTLDVGRSPIVAPVQVASFLSRALPDRCALEFDSKGDSAWEKVQELLPAFTQVRQEERRLTLTSIQPKSG